ncbi:hypothetical protein HWV62_27347 [Athelia sp. TMB]|nr:hypothetical protein HWV62_27347 [Athelia sp. TMB]
MKAIHLVPDEILVQFFLVLREACWQDSDPDLGPVRLTTVPVPILIGGVCKRWRVLAASTPLLWTEIYMDMNLPSTFGNTLHLFRLFASRSETSSLDIVLDFKQETYRGDKSRSASKEQLELLQSLVDALAASVERWKSLHISYAPSFLSMMEQALARRHPWSMQRLGKLVLTRPAAPGWAGIAQTGTPTSISIFLSAPNLRRVDLGESPWRQDLRIPWQQVEQLDSFYTLDDRDLILLLQQSPNLVRLDDLLVVRSPTVIPQRVPIPIYYPLRSLSVRLSGNCTPFLQDVVLPNLHDLRVAYFSAPQQWEVAISFMSASPALRRLVLDIQHYVQISYEDTRSILHALPHLEELELSHCKTSQQLCSNELFADLTLAPPAGCDTFALLPNLRILSLVGALAMDSVIFTAMIRSRSSGVAPGISALQSLHMYLLKNRASLTLDDLAEVRAIMGPRAYIRLITRMPARSPTFPDLL